MGWSVVCDCDISMHKNNHNEHVFIFRLQYQVSGFCVDCNSVSI